MKAYLLLLAVFVWLLSCGDEEATNDQNNDDTGAGGNVDCTSLSIEECEDHGCWLFTGMKYDLEKECYLGGELPAYCLPSDITCGGMMTARWDPEGYCWIFGGLCKAPAGWRDTTQNDKCNMMIFGDHNNIPSCEE